MNSFDNGYVGDRSGWLVRAPRILQRMFILVLLSALSVCSFGAKAATINCTATAASVQVAMPATVVVPRNIAVGQPVTSWYAAPVATLQCGLANQGNNIWMVAGAGVQPQGLGASIGTYVESGISYPLYSTGVSGVAAAFQVATSIAPWNGGQCGAKSAVYAVGGAETTSFLLQPPAPWVGLGCGAANTDFGEQTTLNLSVKLIRVAGSLSQGLTNLSTVALAQAFTGGPSTSDTPPSVFVPVQTLFTMPPVNIALGACTTPDVIVPLGVHAASEMAAVGATTTAVSFNIALNNCPAGMNSIQYGVAANTTVIDASRSVVALNSSSSAAGVGVQLLDTNGNALPLAAQGATNQTFSGYNASTGGSYTIPMKARYYRTGTITEGSANSSMTFTMSYQ